MRKWRQVFSRALGALIVSFLCSSCVLLVGLDPAEKLASEIEKNSKRLRNSGDAALQFGFVPDPQRLSFASNEDLSINLKFNTEHFDREGESTLVFNRWTYTTYHNRFVTVPENLEAKKDACEEFTIKLRKRGEGIELYEIQ
jgi:hypothetical protein